MNSEDRIEHGEPVSEFRSEVGSRLRIVESGYKNRADVAYRAGVSKSTFQRWIEGKADPSFEALAKLSAATGISLDWLAFGRGEMRPGRAHKPEIRQSPETEPDRVVAERLHRSMVAEAAPLDEDLHGRIVEGVMMVYKEEGAGLPPRHLGQLAAQIHGELLAAYAEPTERQIGLKLRLEQLRRELRSTGNEDASNKRSA